MMDHNNIQAYINFLHFKKYLLPASNVLLEKWGSLSDAEIQGNLLALYNHWGIAAETAKAYEEEFHSLAANGSQASTPPPIETNTNLSAEPFDEINALPPPKNNTRKYAYIGIVIVLIVAAIYWYTTKTEEVKPPSESALEQELKQAKETISQEQFIRDQRDSLEQIAKQRELEKIRDFESNKAKYVQQSVSYDYDGMFGGIKKVEVTVNNKSDFKLNEVVVQLQYIKKNDEVYETKNISVYNVSPHKTATVAAPSSKRGTKMKSTIVSVQSDELKPKLQ